MQMFEKAWWPFAACRGVEDPDLFFSVSEVGPGAAEVARAKAICEDCPVRRLCLEDALADGVPYGVFGGTTPEERRAGKYSLFT